MVKEVTQEPRARSQPAHTVNDARKVIGWLLDGQAPNESAPEQVGSYHELYTEMVRAWQDGGTSAARKIFMAYAHLDPRVAALRAADPRAPKARWTADELLTAALAEPPWTVPGLIPIGLVPLAGRPKLGKSWLALQLATAVSTGGQVLRRQVAWGPVFYLALEDTPQRIQDRLRKQGAELGANLTFTYEWPPLPTGLDDLIQEIQHEQYALVIIDTLARFLGRATQQNQSHITEAFGQLQRLALAHNLTILTVDHHRKTTAASGDVIDDVLGATAKMGVVDAALGLYRDRAEQAALLKVTGRDVADQELSLIWHSEGYCWEVREIDEVTADAA